MVEHECGVCGKKFNHKTNYQRHINRKFPCNEGNNVLKSINNPSKSENDPNKSENDPEKSENNPEKSKFENVCIYCNKIFYD